MLNDRQKLTIQHLKGISITSDKDIYKWACKKIKQLQKRDQRRRGNPTKNTRRHSKEYYRGIINHYADLIYNTD